MPLLPELLRAGSDTIASDAFHDHLVASLTRWGLGVGAGVIVGLLLAIAVGWTTRRDRAASVVATPGPPRGLVLLTPLALIAQGSEPAKVCLIALVVAVPVYTSALVAIRHVDDGLVDTAMFFGVGRCGVVQHVVLPVVVPRFLAGLRLAMTSAWLAVIAAEQWHTSTGLGSMAASAIRRLQLDVVLTSATTIVLLIASSTSIVRAAGWLLASSQRAVVGTSPVRPATNR